LPEYPSMAKAFTLKNKELIPKPIYSHINKSFRTIFMIRNSIDYSKFDIQRNNFEF